MLKENNNPIRRQRPQDDADTWAPPAEFRAVSLKAIAELLDTTRSSARRWLKEAGVRPISFGRGAKGAIRYRWSEVQAWLQSRESVE
jgi:predicted DNA-binding transcriptional regulator AlpA